MLCKSYTAAFEFGTVLLCHLWFTVYYNQYTIVINARGGAYIFTPILLEST